jgi:hypothetical protein
MAKRNVNRIDHVVGLVSPENFDAAVSRMSIALQTAFYGPYNREDLGIRVAVAWDAGVELLTPLEGEKGDPYRALLAQRGELWMSVLFGVRDTEATKARMTGIGHSPTIEFSGISGVEPWLERFTRLDEVAYDPSVFGGLPMMFCTIEERDGEDSAG